MASRIRKAWESHVGDHAIAMAWSPEGTQLAVAASTGPIAVFDLSGKKVAEHAGHSGGTFQLLWTAAGVVSSGQDGKIRWWGSGMTADAGAAWVEHLAAHSDGTIASGAGKIVRFFKTGELLGDLPKFTHTVSGLAWRPGHRTIAISVYGGISLWTVNSTAPLSEFKWKGSPLVLAWSPRGDVLAHGNQDATVHFWTVATSLPLQMSGFPTKVRELAWDPTGRYLATGGGDRVCIWDCGGSGPAGTKPQLLQGHRAPLTGLAYQHRGPLLASIGIDGLACVWQPMNKKNTMIGQETHHAEATVLAWSPDDKRLAIGTADGAVTMLSVN